MSQSGENSRHPGANCDETGLKRKLEHLSIAHSPKRRNTDEMSLNCGYNPEQFVMSYQVSAFRPKLVVLYVFTRRSSPIFVENLLPHAIYASLNNLKELESLGFVCTICKKVATKPVSLPCGHTICGEHKDKYQTDRKTDTFCQVEDCESYGKLMPLNDCHPNVAMSRSIRKLLVHCSHFQPDGEGCAEKPMLRDHDKHLSNSCQYTRVGCNKCLEKFRRKDIDQHTRTCTSEVCKFRSIGCENIVNITRPDNQKSLKNHTGLHLALMMHSILVQKEKNTVKPQDIHDRINAAEQRDMSEYQFLR